MIDKLIDKWRQYDLTWGTCKIWITLYTNKGSHTMMKELDYSEAYSMWRGYHIRGRQHRWC